MGVGVGVAVFVGVEVGVAVGVGEGVGEGDGVGVGVRIGRVVGEMVEVSALPALAKAGVEIAASVTVTDGVTSIAWRPPQADKARSADSNNIHLSMSNFPIALTNGFVR